MAQTAMADTAFVVPAHIVDDRAPLAFVSDAPNPALHGHSGAGNPDIRRDYQRTEARLPTIRSCLTEDGHPVDGLDLARLDWRRLDTDAALEVCFFRVLSLIGPDQFAAYFAALSFDLSGGVEVEQMLSYDPPIRRIVTAYSAGYTRERWAGRNAPVQWIFRRAPLARSASLQVNVAGDEIVLVDFTLNTL
ncbi:hypothetical protein [Flavimaricola marinus]|uniref:hypothetical protein n=1 Tax=Flavimaricola marinus TaxID=1819565 RepID=UPI00105489BD|nr:hypothetical protein [Flavimaricola marinus]